MLIYELKNKAIEGDSFSRLLGLCFQHCRYFSFTESQISHADTMFQNRLSQNIYAVISASHWFRHYTLPDNPMRRIIYHANNETFSILNKHCRRLFLFDGRGSHLSWNQTLEDLCFFANDKLFLGTVSHEYICEVFFAE